VSGLGRSANTLRILSRRALQELGTLQASVHEFATLRNAALRLLLSSRHVATSIAQREFWLEFAWADEEYRAAVRRLAQFCVTYRDGSRAAARSALNPPA
jgi:hypothetical protein